jgi:dTMP kinase
MRGRFITLEGIDGAGKSTHLQWLTHFVEGRGIAVRATREPGGTVLGERLRELLLDRDQRLAPETETLLMFAARREHLQTVILPALEAGTWVLCDRFTDASYAYQSGGSGVAWDKIATLEQWVHPALQPDLTLLFDVDPEIGRQRAQQGKTADRFEREEHAYFQRVREAYLRRARSCPERVRVVDAGGSVSAVRKALEELLSNLCSGVT